MVRIKSEGNCRVSQLERREVGCVLGQPLIQSFYLQKPRAVLGVVGAT